MISKQSSGRFRFCLPYSYQILCSSNRIHRNWLAAVPLTAGVSAVQRDRLPNRAVAVAVTGRWLRPMGASRGSGTTKKKGRLSPSAVTHESQQRTQARLDPLGGRPCRSRAAATATQLAAVVGVWDAITPASASASAAQRAWAMA